MYEIWIKFAIGLIATEQMLNILACKRYSGKKLLRAYRNLSLAFIYRFFVAASITLPMMIWATRVNLWTRPTGRWVAIAFVVFDVLALDWYNYFYHFLSHRVPVLWPFHAVHHLDEKLDMSTATRSHFFDKLISSSLRVPLLIVFAVPMSSLVISEFLTLAFSLFHHSARLKVPAWFENSVGLVITTPAFHSVHHSRFLPFTDSNYGFILAVWDHLFKTCLRRLPYAGMRIGLDEQSDQSLAVLLFSPFRKVFEPKVEPVHIQIVQ